jgi:adenylosuccinate synthase
MLDQLFPDVAGVTEWDGLPGKAQLWVRDREAELRIKVRFIGTGPQTAIDLRTS